MGFFSPLGLRGKAFARARVRRVLLVRGVEMVGDLGEAGEEEAGGDGEE